MNKLLSPFRFYRNFLSAKKEICFQIVIEETDLLIKAEKHLEKEISSYVQFLRAQIKSYIEIYPQFLTSLSPLDLDPKAPYLVQQMLKAAKTAQVGPMATVAGAIAEAIALKFVSESPNLIVENGGDTYLCSTTDRIIGILTEEKQKINLGIRIPKKDFPCSLCASSARIGHSLNFGQSDLVVVKSPSGALADGLATYLSNLLKTKDDLYPVLNLAQKIKKITGLFIQIQGQIGVWGDLELIAL